MLQKGHFANMLHFVKPQMLKFAFHFHKHVREEPLRSKTAAASDRVPDLVHIHKGERQLRLRLLQE